MFTDNPHPRELFLECANISVFRCAMLVETDPKRLVDVIAVRPGSRENGLDSRVEGLND